MNDPSKAISVNLSSLLSLKAELQRKQHEVKMAKATKMPANEFKPSKSNYEKEKLKSSNESSYKEIGHTEDIKVYEAEDPGQLEKSRRVLEAKSKYYDRMSRSGGSLNSDDNCLVMFNRKRQQEQCDESQNQSSCASRDRVSSTSSSSSSISNDNDGSNSKKGDDEDEVEYTDCLGRTRKCLRKDLSEALRLDKQLAESMPERLDQSKANWLIDTKGATNSSLRYSDSEEDDEPSFGPKPSGSVYSEALSTMTKHDEQRSNWERKEQENVEKPDVHYQDVFFDEARTHGVGYYAFSTDEAERKQQQRELEQARKATQSEQKRRDDLRTERDKIIVARVLAAKNRIRIRNGLPPISKEEYEQEQRQKLEETEVEARELEREKTEKEAALAAKREAEEAQRERLRKGHVREWDADKSGVTKKRHEDNDEQAPPEEWKYKPERLPMSQEQWNEQQRAVRAPEFAPMPEMMETMPKRLNFNSMPPPVHMWPSSEQQFNSYHSTKREKQFQRRNYRNSSDDVDHSEETTSNASQQQKQGAAIPPPDSLVEGFSGPSDSKRAKSQTELERSIEAGLRFLRENCDKGVLGNKATWTAKADY